MQADEPLRPVPGSAGEHLLQQSFGTVDKAARFYDEQLLDRLNPRMQEFLRRQEIMFVSTSDARGECDCSLRTGPPGFVQVIDDRHVAWPEYRGNGVLASLGNIAENPHVGLLLVDFFDEVVGLHVNGRAEVLPDAQMYAEHGLRIVDLSEERRTVAWVRVAVQEAYIHCSRHVPRLAKVARAAGRKGGDVFDAARTPAPWAPGKGAAEAGAAGQRCGTGT